MRKEEIEGRILKGIGGLYFVRVGQELYQCKARGVFRKNNVIPTVGDWVVVQVLDQEKKEGYLHEIRPRKNLLIRPRIANVDQALILFSHGSPVFNLDLLDRLILLVEAAGIGVCIGINKMDLGDWEELEDLRRIYEGIGYPVFAFIATEGLGVEEIRPYFKDKISVLAGPSGVGKSSLINRLCPEVQMETGELSRKIGRGRHTTRHAELIEFEPGSFIADTPGFTSLSLTHIKEEPLSFYFREMREYQGACRFSNCCHVDEPGCAVKEQVGRQIHPLRYQRYIQLYQQQKEES